MAPSAFSCAVVDEWLASGVVASIQRDLRHESRRRSKLAASLLGASELVRHSDAYNVWLPMKRETANSLVAAAAEIGLKLTLPETMLADPQDEMSGLRICLGSPSFEDLSDALKLLAKLLKPQA